jgi:hypothetical protein
VGAAPHLVDPFRRATDWRKKSKRLGVWKVGMAAGRQRPPSRRRGEAGRKAVVGEAGGKAEVFQRLEASIRDEGS